jgi:hypothetical protein
MLGVPEHELASHPPQIFSENTITGAGKSVKGKDKAILAV